MMLGTMKEVFGVTHVRDDEEEVLNVKRMHVIEEEVPVPQGPFVAVDDNGSLRWLRRRRLRRRRSRNMMTMWRKINPGGHREAAMMMAPSAPSHL
jgi:hypothetical protein